MITAFYESVLALGDTGMPVKVLTKPFKLIAYPDDPNHIYLQRDRQISDCYYARYNSSRKSYLNKWLGGRQVVAFIKLMRELEVTALK